MGKSGAFHRVGLRVPLGAAPCWATLRLPRSLTPLSRPCVTCWPLFKGFEASGPGYQKRELWIAMFSGVLGWQALCGPCFESSTLVTKPVHSFLPSPREASSGGTFDLFYIVFVGSWLEAIRAYWQLNESMISSMFVLFADWKASNSKEQDSPNKKKCLLSKWSWKPTVEQFNPQCLIIWNMFFDCKITMALAVLDCRGLTNMTCCQKFVCAMATSQISQNDT